MNLLARYPGFRWLWGGQFLSQLGTNMFLILGLWEIQLKSPFLLSLAGLAMTIPNFLGMMGGVLVDRHDARRIMLMTDIVRGGAVAAALLMPLSHTEVLVWAVIVLIAVNSLGNALFGPAEMVVVPRIVQSQDLAGANGLYSLTSQLSGAIGAAIGGAAVAAIGIRLIFGLDAGSFGASALSILLIAGFVRPRAAEVGDKTPGTEEHREGILQSLKDGWAGFRNIPMLGPLLPVIVLGNFSFMAGFTMLPYWVHHHLHATALWYGLADASWAAGMVMGSLLSGYFGQFPMKRVLVWASVMQAVFTAGFAMSHVTPLSSIALLLSGASNGIINALFLTLLQRIVPENVQGRVFGLVMTVFGLATPLGSLAAGVFLSILPLYWAWALSAGTALALAITLARQPGSFEDVFQPAVDAPGDVIADAKNPSGYEPINRPENIL